MAAFVGKRTEKHCEICAHWKQSGSPKAGECRRYAPPSLLRATIPTKDRQHQRALWPITDAADWCGEYERASKSRDP